MKRWIIIIVILLAAGITFGVYEYNRGPRDLHNEKSDLKIEASSLLSAFEQDETKANELYLDKIVEVSGTILEIPTTKTNNIVLDAGSPMSNIVCELGSGFANNDLQVGDKVVVKGQCTGYLMDVVLVKSVIINK